jgi:hypothetical protein
MRTFLGGSLAAVFVAGCATAAPTEPRAALPIVDVKMLAGAWTGYVVIDTGLRVDNASLVIGDTGSFLTSGQARGRGLTVNGEITAASGNATYRTTRGSSGTLTLFKAGGGKELLRFDGSTATATGYSEWERSR